MSAQELVKGLHALDDDDVRQRVAAGDLAAAGGLELTDEEAGLLRGAAEDYPEVAGFAFDTFLKLDGISGDPHESGSQGNVSFSFGASSPKLTQVQDYLTIKFSGI